MLFSENMRYCLLLMLVLVLPCFAEDTQQENEEYSNTGQYAETQQPAKINIQDYLHPEALIQKLKLSDNELFENIISSEEAIKYAVLFLKEINIENILICEVKWIVAPLGGYLIDGFGLFEYEDSIFETFRVGVRDGSEGNSGEEFVFIARSIDVDGSTIWYPYPGPDYEFPEDEEIPEGYFNFEFLLDRERFESLDERYSQ